MHRAVRMCDAGGMEDSSQDRSTELLERLLAAHAESFDIERDASFAGRNFDAHAQFRQDGERYVLTRRAKLWGISIFEHLLFQRIDHLSEAVLEDLLTFMRTEALEEIDHMTTYLSLVLIADSADEEALRTLKKTSFRKNFAFGLKGWTDLRLCAVDLARGKTVSNAQGKELGKTVAANLALLDTNA